MEGNISLKSSFLVRSDNILGSSVNSMAQLVGAPMNIIVLYLSVNPNAVKERCRYYFGSLAIADLFMACTWWLHCVLYWVFNYLAIPLTPLQCSAMRTLAPMGIVPMFLMTPACAFDRYLLVVKNKKMPLSYLSYYNIAIYTIALSFSGAANIFLADHLTDSDKFCQYKLLWKAHKFLFVFTTAGIFLSVGLNLMILRHLKRYFKQSQAIRQTRANAKKDDRNIVRAILIQTVSPVALTLPAGLYIVYAVVFGHFQNVNKYLWILSIAFFHLNRFLMASLS